MEFAVVLPFMLSLLVGGYETLTILTIYRKLGHTAEAVTAFATGTGTSSTNAGNMAISSTRMTNLLATSRAIMFPYSSTNLGIVTSAVGYTSANGYKVAWSVGQNATAWPTNAAPPLPPPAGLVSNGQQVIVARATYNYSSIFTVFVSNYWGASSITLQRTSYKFSQTGKTIDYPNPN